MIKAVIFDWNGVLTDSLALDHMIFLTNKTTKGELPTSVDFYRSIWTKNAFEVLNELGIDTSEKGEARYKDMYLKNIKMAKIFPGIKDAINTLKKRYKLGIITSNYTACVDHFLKENGMEKSFDVVLTADNHRRKEEKINIFLRKFGLTKQEVIYVGDTVSDVVACKNSGIRIIAVTWGYHGSEYFADADPDFMAEKPSDLAKILEKL